MTLSFSQRLASSLSVFSLSVTVLYFALPQQGYSQDFDASTPAEAEDTAANQIEEIAIAEDKLALEQAAIEAELAEIQRISLEAGEKAEDLAKRGDDWKQANAERLRELADLVAWLNKVAPQENATAGYGFANNTGGSSLAVGFNNHVLGFNAIAVGEGLVVHGSNTTVVGTFNATQGNAAEAIFVVGIGKADARANALEVYANGEVILPRPSSAIPMYSPEQ